jgi:hypothetical protein
MPLATFAKLFRLNRTRTLGSVPEASHKPGDDAGENQELRSICRLEKPEGSGDSFPEELNRVLNGLSAFPGCFQ